MIPSLVIVRTNRKRLITLTGKKNIKIGSTEDADLVVNHLKLDTDPIYLGPGSISAERLVKKREKLHSLFPGYSFSVEGLSVSLNDLRFLVFLAITLCTGAFYLGGHLLYGKSFYRSQDWTPIALPASGVYGFCRQDNAHAEGVRFSFHSDKSQTCRLQFSMGGNGDDKTLVISLNGTVISQPLSLPVGWGEKTSVPLPFTALVKGNNIVEVRPQRTTSGNTSWGISDPRILQFPLLDASDSKNKAIDSQLILKALEKPETSRRELAGYYENIFSRNSLNSHGGDFADNEKILEKLELRMKRELHQVAFDVRASIIRGDVLVVQKLLDDTKNWIPEGWVEGWEIYHELCRQTPN